MTSYPEDPLLIFCAPDAANKKTGGYIVNESLAAGLRDFCSVHYLLINDKSEDPIFLINREESRPAVFCIDSLFLVRGETGLVFKIKKKGFPLLLLCHYLNSLDPFIDQEERLLREKIEQRHLLLFDAIVCPSSFLAERVRRITAGNTAVFHIPPGIRKNEAASPRGGLFNKEAKNGIQLLTVSNWTPLKNMHFFLHIFEAAEDEKLTWRIAGCPNADGSYMTELRRKIAQSRKSRSISVLGSIDQDALFREYEEADILIHPSLMESYGLSVAEASAAGIPVIAHRTGGIPEIISHEVSGYLCRINDKTEWRSFMERLCASGTLRKRMSEAAVRSRKRLNTPRSAAQQLFHAALSVLGAAAVTKGEDDNH